MFGSFQKIPSPGSWARWHSRLRRSLLSVLIVCALTGCGGGASSPANATIPSAATTAPSSLPPTLNLISPQEKLAETASPGFTRQLFDEGVDLQPAMAENGTQVGMGFWSFGDNRANLIQLLDAINVLAPSNVGIWDEGTSTSTADQYPDYVEMVDEYWYERAQPRDGLVYINGVGYLDDHPVTLQQADDIWGQYSQRYTDMAMLISQKTTRRADAWCFVIGAKANRVFYKYELPELKIMEQGGWVTVHFANQPGAQFDDPADWTVGTANAPVPSRSEPDIPPKSAFDR